MPNPRMDQMRVATSDFANQEDKATLVGCLHATYLAFRPIGVLSPKKSFFSEEMKKTPKIKN